MKTGTAVFLLLYTAIVCESGLSRDGKELQLGEILRVTLGVKRHEAIRLNQGVSPNDEIGQQTLLARPGRLAPAHCRQREAFPRFGPDLLFETVVNPHSGGFKKAG